MSSSIQVVFQPVAQGDILLIPIDPSAIPVRARPVRRETGRLVLARGEVTGHAHVIGDPLAELVGVSADVDSWLRNSSGAALLTHEDHGAIILDAPAYVVRRQVQYTPTTIARAAD